MTTTLATGSDVAARRDGFTLIELSIVVFIIGVLVALSIPNFVRSYNGMLLNSTARSFATMCQLARIQAVSRQQNATLHVDLDRQIFWVSQPARNEDGDQEDLSLKAVQVSDRVALVAAVRQDLPVTVDKHVEVGFYPNGTCDPVYIILQGMEKGTRLCALIDPITVRATIYPVK